MQILMAYDICMQQFCEKVPIHIDIQICQYYIFIYTLNRVIEIVIYYTNEDMNINYTHERTHNMKITFT